MNVMTPLDMSARRQTTDAAAVAPGGVRLAEAEATLVAARQRLHAQQRAMVIGSGDSWDLDQAVLEYRAARAAVEVARAAEPRGDAGGTAGREPEARADDPAPELRFARWLIEGAQRVRPLAA